MKTNLSQEAPTNAMNPKEEKLWSHAANIPTFNIGVVGHVQNGKSSIVKALTTEDTKRSYEEQKRGISINLGYANGYLFGCRSCGAMWVECRSRVPDAVSYCGDCECQVEALMGLSFIDCPGHHEYVSQMSKGSFLMDMAIVVTACNSEPDQIQTLEHLAILEVLNIKRLLVLQNKCDLVTPERCFEHHDLIRSSLKGTAIDTCEIIPVCALQGFNVDLIPRCIYKLLKQAVPFSIPKHLTSDHCCFSVIRSFDINKPGCDVDRLRGGVVGGAVLNGSFCVGDDIVFYPGILNNKGAYSPLRTRIVSMRCEEQELGRIALGGLYAIGTSLDPALTKRDFLVGQVAVKAPYRQQREQEQEQEQEQERVIQSKLRTVLKLKFTKLRRNFDGQKVPSIAADQQLRLMVGNSLVKIVVHSWCKQTRIAIIRLQRPVFLPAERVLIYTKPPGILMGFGDVQFE